jgi:hypothetical protein
MKHWQPGLKLETSASLSVPVMGLDQDMRVGTKI